MDRGDKADKDKADDAHGGSPFGGTVNRHGCSGHASRARGWPGDGAVSVASSRFGLEQHRYKQLSRAQHANC